MLLLSASIFMFVASALMCTFTVKRSATQSGTPTLDDYFQIWYASRIGTIAPSTAYNNEKRYTVISRFIGKLRLNEITLETVTQLQQSMLSATIIRAGVDTGRHYAVRTIKEEIALLSSILKSAEQAGLIAKNPCVVVKPVRNTSGKSIRDGAHRALTDSEIELFFSEATDSFYYPLLVFLLQTGCRAGEAAALTWKDIDFEQRLVSIHRTLEQTGSGKYEIAESPKTASGIRKVRLSDKAMHALELQRVKNQALFQKHADSEALSANLIFTNTRGGYVSRNNINTAIMTVVKRIRKNQHAMDSFSSHAFRHSFATKCVDQGMQPEILKEILGHSDIKMTMETYYHLSQERMDGAMKKVEIPLAA